MKWILIESAKGTTSIDLDDLVLNIVDDELAEEGVGILVSFAVLAGMLGSAGMVRGA